MNDLEETLGKRAEIVSFEEDWAADPPEEAEGAGLQEYIIPVCPTSRNSETCR